MSDESLALADCAAVRIFREISRVLMEDPGLDGRIIRWITWNGVDDSTRAPAPGEFPCLSLTPVLSSDQFHGPEGFQVTLRIVMRLEIDGYNVDQLLNIYRSIVGALHLGGDEGLALMERLVAMGAKTGEVLADSPSWGPINVQTGSNSSRLWAVGQLSINVIEDINT